VNSPFKPGDIVYCADGFDVDDLEPIDDVREFCGVVVQAKDGLRVVCFNESGPENQPQTLYAGALGSGWYASMSAALRAKAAAEREYAGKCLELAVFLESEADRLAVPEPPPTKSGLPSA
jgi:hypothetical protein